MNFYERCTARLTVQPALAALYKKLTQTWFCQGEV